jgi:hypothetical protein
MTKCSYRIENLNLLWSQLKPRNVCANEVQMMCIIIHWIGFNLQMFKEFLH